MEKNEKEPSGLAREVESSNVFSSILYIHPQCEEDNSNTLSRVIKSRKHYH